MTVLCILAITFTQTRETFTLFREKYHVKRVTFTKRRDAFELKHGKFFKKKCLSNLTSTFARYNVKMSPVVLFLSWQRRSSARTKPVDEASGANPESWLRFRTSRQSSEETIKVEPCAQRERRPASDRLMGRRVEVLDCRVSFPACQK